MTTPEIDPKLLDAGRRALARHGYGGATAERIAREAGVNRSTLHRRGVGKEEILAALTERAIADYRSRVVGALTNPGSARERLELALVALCDSAEENLELLLALRSQSDALFHEEGEEALTQSVYTEPLERLLRDGAADGSLRGLDPVRTATVVFNLVGWTYIHLRSGHGWPAARAREETIDIAMNGLSG